MNLPDDLVPRDLKRAPIKRKRGKPVETVAKEWAHEPSASVPEPAACTAARLDDGVASNSTVAAEPRSSHEQVPIPVQGRHGVGGGGLVSTTAGTPDVALPACNAAVPSIAAEAMSIAWGVCGQYFGPANFACVTTRWMVATYNASASAGVQAVHTITSQVATMLQRGSNVLAPASVIQWISRRFPGTNEHCACAATSVCVLCKHPLAAAKWVKGSAGPTFHYGVHGVMAGSVGIRVCTACGTQHDLQCFSPGPLWLAANMPGLSARDATKIGAFFFVFPYVCVRMLHKQVRLIVHVLHADNVARWAQSQLAAMCASTRPLTQVECCDVCRQGAVLVARVVSRWQWFMYNSSSVFSYALMRNFEASRVTTPETTFEAFVTCYNLTHGCESRSTPMDINVTYPWFSSARPKVSTEVGNKGTHRYHMGVKPFAAAWRKAFMTRACNEFLEGNACVLCCTRHVLVAVRIVAHRCAVGAIDCVHAAPPRSVIVCSRGSGFVALGTSRLHSGHGKRTLCRSCACVAR